MKIKQKNLFILSFFFKENISLLFKDIRHLLSDRNIQGNTLNSQKKTRTVKIIARSDSLKSYSDTHSNKTHMHIAIV